MDVEIFAMLRKKPTTVPKEAPKGFENSMLRKIYKEGWYVVFQARDKNDGDYRKTCFLLPDKHLYTTSYVEFMLDLVSKYRGNSEGDKKCFSDMIRWYVQVRKALLSIMSKVFEVQSESRIDVCLLQLMQRGRLLGRNSHAISKDLEKGKLGVKEEKLVAEMELIINKLGEEEKKIYGKMIQEKVMIFAEQVSEKKNLKRIKFEEKKEMNSGKKMKIRNRKKFEGIWIDKEKS
ncbi:unnamed protein product [Lactuca saligna]|uniref:Uncharacterized protein n=1 Tax=Lactuca saligna TaxID=75948 RepID=A0AA36EJI4_LACSI|nr:unnamed protein product [Lactuca saligna]